MAAAAELDPDAIRQLYHHEGLTLAETSKALGVSVPTLRQAMKRHGIERRVGKPQPEPEEDILAMIERLAPEFLPDPEMAAIARLIRRTLRPGITFALEDRAGARGAWGPRSLPLHGLIRRVAMTSPVRIRHATADELAAGRVHLHHPDELRTAA
jgi:hypothetical protein